MDIRLHCLQREENSLIKTFLRDAVARKMTSKQIAEARRLAKELNPAVDAPENKSFKPRKKPSISSKIKNT
jgi:hypothetical protein